MSILYVCAVRDSAMQAYSRPMFVPAPGIAVRSFTDEVNRQDKDNQLFNHPDDFELWFLGRWDEESGMFIDPEIRCLARAKDVKQG